MSAYNEAKDSLIRAAAAMTLEISIDSLETAFTELSTGIVWLAQVPGINRVAMKFASMLIDQLQNKGRGSPEYAPTEPHTVDVVIEENEDMRVTMGLDGMRGKCPTCGK